MNLIQITNNQNYGLVVSSNSVADKLGVLHKDLLEKIDGYLERFKEISSAELSAQFYIPSEYKARNRKVNRNYLITKKGIAQLVSGYNASVPIAFALNVAYINKFDEMEQIIRNRNDSDWLITRKEGKLFRRIETDAIQELIPYAISQGSKRANMLYITYSKLSK